MNLLNRILDKKIDLDKKSVPLSTVRHRRVYVLTFEEFIELSKIRDIDKMSVERFEDYYLVDKIFGLDILIKGEVWETKVLKQQVTLNIVDTSL